VRQYAIVIERGPTSCGAYVPDLLHLRAMIEDGDPALPLAS
jgi:hypothetical protein